MDRGSVGAFGIETGLVTANGNKSCKLHPYRFGTGIRCYCISLRIYEGEGPRRWCGRDLPCENDRVGIKLYCRHTHCEGCTVTAL